MLQKKIFLKSKLLKSTCLGVHFNCWMTLTGRVSTGNEAFYWDWCDLIVFTLLSLNDWGYLEYLLSETKLDGYFCVLTTLKKFSNPLGVLSLTLLIKVSFKYYILIANKESCYIDQEYRFWLGIQIFWLVFLWGNGFFI